MTAPDTRDLGTVLLALPPEARRAAAARGQDWAGATLGELRGDGRRGLIVQRWECVVAALDLLCLVGAPTEDGGPIYVYRSAPTDWRGDRPWVARITGTSTRFGLRRQFVESQRDWSEAKRASSGKIRGLVHSFVLRSGWVVEVQDRGRRGGMVRAFGWVTPAGIEEISAAQVDEWLAEQRR